MRRGREVCPGLPPAVQLRWLYVRRWGLLDSTVNVPAILKGDGYRQITGLDDTKAKIAVWGNGDHSALVTGLAQDHSVNQVTGKAGIDPGLNTTTPEEQWKTGTPVYYE